MSTPINLSSLPNEIVSDIISRLSPHDLAQLAATCKKLSALIEPLLWTDIEFHEPGYHESRAELNDPPPFVLPSQRQYHEKKQSSKRKCEDKAALFFNLLKAYESGNQNRLRQLASRVQSLCTVIDPIRYIQTRYEGEVMTYLNVWTLLPYFVNLEVLELHGKYARCDEFWTSASHQIGPTLSNLRFAKLSAYIPPPVVSWVFFCGSKLERLELALLDQPTRSGFTRTPVIPKPLGRFLNRYSLDQLSLPQLRHLYLCQPSRGAYLSSQAEYDWADRAAEESLQDWRTILTVSGKTLETLVLEQRVGAQTIECHMPEDVFVMNNVKEASSENLLKFLELRLKDTDLPSLKDIYLHGMAIGDNFKGNESLAQLLKGRNIACEARLGRWCLFDRASGQANWSNWAARIQDKENDQIRNLKKWDTVLAKI